MFVNAGCHRKVLGGENGAHPVKTPAHGLIEGIGQVGGAQDEDAGLVGVDSLHLHQELCLDAARGLALAVPARAAQRVNLHSSRSISLALRQGEFLKALRQPIAMQNRCYLL